MSADIAYRSVGPSALEAWQRVRHEYEAWPIQVQEWLTDIGLPDCRVRTITDSFTGAVAIVGVDAPADITPAGWRWHRDGYIVPARRSAAGRAADEYMRTLAGPPIRTLLEEATGMPSAWLTPDSRLVNPGIKRYGDHLYALMSAEPDPAPSAEHWERIPLSVYYAAVEAHERAEAVTA